MYFRCVIKFCYYCTVNAYRGVDPGAWGVDPWKYVGGVRVCFDPITMSHSFIQNCCWITLLVSHYQLRMKVYVKMEGKTNFSSRRLQAVRNRDCLEKKSQNHKEDGSRKRWRVSTGDWPWPPYINATDRLYVLRSATAWNVAVLSPLLGITWLFGVLSVSKQLVVFQYLFAISNTLQVQYITPAAAAACTVVRRHIINIPIHRLLHLREITPFLSHYWIS